MTQAVLRRRLAVERLSTYKEMKWPKCYKVPENSHARRSIVPAPTNTRPLAQILFSSDNLSLNPRFSDPEAISPNPPACFAPRNRSTSRRTLALMRHVGRSYPHS